MAAPKAPTPREPIAARGQELLALIAGADNGVLMLTQDEGAEIVANGFAVADPANVVGDTAGVSLTDTGRATLTATGGTPTKYEIEDNVPLPATRNSGARRGRTSAYPIEMLEVGQSFHVAKSAENPNPANRLASSVTAVRIKYSTKTGEMETVTQRTYTKDEAGKFIKDETGKRVIASETEVQREKLAASREFDVRSVGSEDPKGEGARVWRTR